MKKIISVIFVILISMLIATNVLASTGTVNVAELNLRESASTSSKVLGKLSAGTKLTIISTEGDWYKVNYNGIEGYVSKTYIKDVAEDETNNSTGTTSEETNTETNYTNITEDTTLYVLPLLNSTKLNTIKKDTKVLLISVNGNWCYVQTDTESGWVISSKLQSTQLKIQGETINSGITNQNNNVDEYIVENDINENIVVQNQIEENTVESTNTVENTTVGNTTSDNSVENTISNTTNNTTSSVDKFPTTMYVNVDAVNIRSEASTSSSKVTSIGKNVPVRVTGKEGEWYKVEVSDGKGYILGTYLSQQKQ